MLTYETLVALLLSGAEQSKLAIRFSQEQYDPHALNRTFTITCIPRRAKPHQPAPTAVLSFTWDVAQAAVSILGSDTLCDMFHQPDEPCPHEAAGCSYEAFVDIDVVYEIPLTPEDQHDIAGVPLIAKAIQEITAELTYDEQPLEVDVQMRFTDHGQALVNRVAAHQQWTLDEELHDEQLLLRSMIDLCEEIAMLLDVLHHLHSDDTSINGDSEFPDYEDLSDLKTYLRPPTA